MCSVPVEESAATRAVRLAQLENLLNEAQRLIPLLPLAMEQQAVAQDLHVRIQAARVEVHALRLSRSAGGRAEVHPQWIEFNPWRQYSAADDQTP